MAITLLATRGTNNQSSSVLNKPTGIKTLTTRGYTPTKNNGGVLGGIGYVGEKLAVGIVSSLEGINDYTFSGIAKLFGADDWAEDIIKNDWFGDWYSHPEEWYNPGSGWQFAGDVAGGIGSSVPSIAAAAAAAYFTGGAAAPAAASFLTAGLGAAGRGTKEAYEETGRLTGKEFGYGALTGVTEGGIEAVSNLIGMGSGQLIKGITKSIGKETAEAFAKQGLLTTLGKGFAGEAFEESMSEILDPYWKRITYDPNAKNASANEILYAGLVGGVSGMLMSGSGYAYDSANSFIKGHRLSQNGGDAEVLETSGYFSAFEKLNHTEDELFSEIINTRSSLLKSLESTGGKVTTVAQKRQLGALSRANTAATVKNFVSKRAINIVNNADLIVERLNAYGYKTADGKPLTFTAEELTAGYNPQNPSSIYKALQTNEKLRSLAVADATGQMMIDSAEFTKTTLTGKRLASQVDLNRFVETATPKEISAVSKALNIDNWSSLDADTFAQKITDYVQNGGVQQTLKAKELKSSFNTLSAENARPVPKLINLATDGMRRYSDGDLDIAVERKGDTYTIYDYQRDSLSRQMTRSEVNNFLREYSNNREQVLAEARAETEAIEKMRTETAEIDTYARENIKDYARLNAPSQSMIRKLIREGRSKGVKDSDLLDYAKISAHSGIDIQFDKESTYRGVNEDGSADYGDGFYEADRNRIVVNPESKRSFERLLLHELDHAIRKFYGSDGKRHVTVFKQALEGVTPEVREKIVNKYKKTAAPGESVATIMDETNAYYAEEILSNKHTLEKLVETEPTLKDKILSFFKGASSDYADTPKLSGAAKKYYRTYKKLFDEFSARNAQNNATDAQLDAELAGMMRMEKAVNSAIATENTVPAADIPQNNVLEPITDASGSKKLQNAVFDNVKPTVDNTADNAHLSTLFAKNAQKTPLTNINQENMHVSGESVKYYALSDSYSEKDSIKSQLKQNESVINDMSPVANINYEVVDKKKAREDAKQLYKSLGYRVDRQNFGIIEIGEREISESSNYLNTKAEFAAWMTVPKVLKRGKLVTDHPNHKNEGFSTYTIAAPVLINGVRGNVAVTVKKTGKNRYKTHRILMPDGSQFVYEKTKKDAEPTGSDIVLKNKGPDISSASIDSISRPEQKSNTSSEKSSENSSGKDFALDIESENVKLRAEWEGDRVFSEKVIEERLYKQIEQFKILNKNVKSEIIHDLWVRLNEGRSGEQRKVAEIEATNKIVEAIVLNPKSDIGLTDSTGRRQLTEKVIKVVSGIAKSGKLSERVKLEKKYAQQAKTKANAEKREAIAERRKELSERAKTEISQEKEKANARAEKTVAREREKIENEKILLKAEYETDRVYNEKTVESRLYDKIDQFKYLKKEVKEKIARDLWHDLNESNGTQWRNAIGIEYTVKIVDEILHNPNNEYDFTNPSDRQRLNKIVSEAIKGIIKTGRLSTSEKLGRRLKQEAKTEANAKQRILNNIHRSLKKIDDRKNRRFMSASSYKSAEFKKTIETLTQIDWRGNFSTNIAKDLMNELREWYSADNEMLFPSKKSENDFTKAAAEYSPAIAGRLWMLSKYEDGEYGVNELKALDEVITYFVKLIDEYDKVYLEGKWQDGEALARELVDMVMQQENVGVPVMVRAMRNKIFSAGFRTYGDALSVMKLADMYGNGIFTRYYNEWLHGEINADAEVQKIKEKYDAFMKENRKYLKNAETETVKLGSSEIRKIDLISYAMTLKRKQAWESIAEGGVVFVDPKNGNDIHLFPTSEMANGKGYPERLEATMQAELDKVMSMLSEKDVEYMKALEAGFELARTTKAMGDMQRLGFVSVIEGYYYPIKHAYTEHLSDFDVELISTDRYANASFNKNQIEEAKSAIRISSADAVFNSHVKGVSRYLYLSPIMDSFNKLFKLKLGNADSLQRTIAQSKTAWRDNGKLVGFDYLQNLMLDTMGTGKNIGDDFFAKIRGAAVTFSLGANPKVLLTQLSSLISSTSILSWSSHAKAIGIWNGNVDDYSIVAKLRNSDYTVAKAEGVIDKINTTSRIFTAGVSLMDRFVVTRAWAACQAEIAKNGGPDVGTEENRIAAGKLLDKVILETQQNSLTSRRTEGARRGNILTKSMQMYKSDAITSFGRAVDGWGEANYLNALLKSNTLNDADRANVEKRLGTARKKLGKAVASIAEQAIFIMLITELFRNFYGKNDDETEEEKRTRLFVDLIGNLISGVPVLSEVWSTLTSNFGFDSMELSAMNDFFDTAKNVVSYAEKRLEGKATDRDGNKLIQDMLYSMGQLLGVPTRNIKNLSYGVVRLFNKDAAYKWDIALYKKSYSADLNEALGKGDMGRATMIMELALGEKLGSGFSTEALVELTRLAKLGEKIIPGGISDTIMVDGEEFTLNDNQYRAVRAEYDNIINAVNSFIENKFYKSLSDEQKAAALRKLYSIYKDIAYDTVLGTNKNGNAVIMSKIFVGDMFNAYLTLGVLESDKDKSGKTISGSKRKKVISAINKLGVTTEQKLLLICAAGYSIKDGDVRGLKAGAAKTRLLKYIFRIKGLSAHERAEIAEMCGFDVVNGKIIKNPSLL